MPSTSKHSVSARIGKEIQVLSNKGGGGSSIAQHSCFSADPGSILDIPKNFLKLRFIDNTALNRGVIMSIKPIKY